MRHHGWILALGIALGGCAAGPAVEPPAPTPGQPAGLAAAYAEAAKAGGRLYALDPAASSVRILVFRGGRAARLGHNHVLSAPRFEGFVLVPDDGPEHARFDLAFRLDQLEVDAPALRRELGPGFATAITPEAVAATREHMLGEDNMQAARYPYVRIHSLRIVGAAPYFAAEVAVELHGTVRTLWLPLTVEGLPGQVSVEGSFVLRQSDFGVQPYSVLGGLLSVRDEVLVRFKLAGK